MAAAQYGEVARGRRERGCGWFVANRCGLRATVSGAVYRTAVANDAPVLSSSRGRGSEAEHRCTTIELSAGEGDDEQEQ